MSRWTVVSRNGGVSRFLCFFLWGLRAAEGWGGQEAPCKHLDLGWVRGWCWAKPGVPGWRSGCPSDTGLGRFSMCSPPPSQNKTMVKTRTDAQEGGTAAIPSTWDKGGLQTGRPVVTPPPSLWSSGRGQGEPRREKGGKRLAGTGGERGPLAPIFLRGWGQQSQRWPILPGPAAHQKRPQSFRLFLMMTSVTASNTNCTFLVSVAHVKCV